MFGRGKRTSGDEERSAAGQPILRHQPVERGWQPPAQVGEGQHEVLEAHYERHLGPCSTVWHEIVSDKIHLDVYMWRPTAERPMFTFATMGMSDLPMTLPPGVDPAAAYAELIVCLPPDWPVPADKNAVSPWTDENAYFPIWWLKQLARLPHEYSTWLGFGHTVPNGDPAKPFTPPTRLCGWVLLPPMTLPQTFRNVTLPGDRKLEIFGIVAVTADEMDRKLASGIDSLFDGFDSHGVSELLQIGRASSL